MTTLFLAIGVFLAYFVAYHTYGRFLARKVFRLRPDAVPPSIECRDDVDYCPTNRQVIFGHHFTSIAGTGPIVGPAIAVFWGWLPALLWVLVGPIFIGAVHDLGALVVSMRNRGQTVGEIAGRLISPRAKYLFLVILFFALTLVLAVFGLVIATIFKLYPESVLSVWVAMPVAIAVGYYVYRKGGHLLVPSLAALVILYGAIVVGVYYLPVELPAAWGDPVIFWTVILFIYCFFASVLPVWLLLQPRDFVNSHQLLVALGLLVVGVLVASLTGRADINSADAIVPAAEIPADAPPILPFLFITIACGAVSGFHCLVSSGTTSKQIAAEPDAQYVGYGAMLMEGVLAVIVILACCAGVGMGEFQKAPATDSIIAHRYEPVMTALPDGTMTQVVGHDAWRMRYKPGESWESFGLGQTVGAFVEGGANFLSAIGVPIELGVGIIAVLVACFAATTLDTATRLHRYVVQELAGALRIAPLKNKYGATALVVVLGFTIAMLPAPGRSWGTGGLILWPLFGATNQLLAGLALLVTLFYLWRRGQSAWFIALPAAVMILLPPWAMLWQMFNAETGWWHHGRYLLIFIGMATIGLQLWMVVESLLLLPRARGVLEEALPPLDRKPAGAVNLEEPAMAGGRSC